MENLIEAGVVYGRKEPEHCSMCGKFVQKTPTILGSSGWGVLWAPEAHECLLYEEHLARKEEQEAEKRFALLRQRPQELVRNALLVSGVPKKYSDGLAGLYASYGRTPMHVRLQDMLNTVVRRGEKGLKGVWLFGPPATGKTSSLTALALDLSLAAGFAPGQVRYMAWQDYAQAYRQQVSEKEHYHEVSRHFQTARVLVLDDIGAGNWTTSLIGQFDLLVDQLYRRFPLLLLASNESPMDFQEKLALNSTDTQAERIARRLAELTEPMIVGHH